MNERKLGLALTLGSVLEVLEILRRLPRWLLAAVALATYGVLYVAVAHPWSTVAVVVAAVALRRIAGRRPSNI